MDRSTSRILMVLFGFMLVWQGVGLAADREGQVTADRLNVRGGPGTANAVVSSAERGEIVVILGESGEWLNVRLADGSEGWVAKKFVEEVAPAAGEGEGTQAAPPRSSREISGAKQESGGGGGGSALGSVLKWGCLLGAGAVGYLAYDEHTQGNDAYDEYKADILEGGQDPYEAEPKREDAKDHDGKSLTYSIAAGSLFGAFLLQQFLLGGDEEDPGDSAARLGGHVPLVRFNPFTGEVRAQVLLARF